MYLSQARILGFADKQVATNEIKVGNEDFNSLVSTRCERSARPRRGFSFITICKGTAPEIMQSTDSPSVAWRELLQWYRARGLKEKSTLMRDFNSLKMELVEDPIKFTVRVDRVARELRQVGKTVDVGDKNLAILNGLMEEYTVDRRMLGAEDHKRTRAHSEKVNLNRYERLRVKTF